MALQKQYNDKFGNTHSQAYYRVTHINMDVNNSSSSVRVCVYKDATARNENKEPIEYFTYGFDNTTPSYNTIFGVTAMENKNPIKGIYDEIKTYPEFSGSTDV